MSTLAEQQFVSLDRAVSSRYFELVARSCIASQDVDHWLTDYNQLQRFAEQNAGDARIRQGWSEEKPRYVNSQTNLKAKVCERTPIYSVPYTPRLYDTSMRVGGCGGGSGITQPTMTDYGTTSAPMAPRTPNTINVQGGNYSIPSLGDALKSLLGIKPIEAPSINGEYPDSPLVDQSEIVTGVITAIVIGAVMYIIHRATKKG
jgi:hypothetical protein